MDIFSTDSPSSIRLQGRYLSGRAGHPLMSLEELSELPEGLEFPVAATVADREGVVIGSGILDPHDPVAAWRRFSWQEGASFDGAYVADAIASALERRSDEACQRLIASDADYLPGLTVDIYAEVLLIKSEHAAVEVHLEAICEIFSELIAPREIVLDQRSAHREAFGLEQGVSTLSGQNLKGFWIEVDELQYRLDPLKGEKPGFFLDLREQHALVGSLCAGRRVLDGFAHQGAFALQAARAEATEVVAVDHSSDAVKTIGANAQKNGLTVQAVEADMLSYLQESEAGSWDAIILDPPETCSESDYTGLLKEAFRVLTQGGLLAVYARNAEYSSLSFEQMVAKAAASEGREGRIFARTGQPFDFPTLLQLPESAYLKGIILQVE